MAVKDIKTKSTVVLFQYLTLLERTIELIEAHWQTVKKLKEDDKISSSYFDETKKNLSKKLSINNSIIDSIESEIFKRMKRDLGLDVVLPTYAITAEESLKQEYIRHEKMLKEKPKKKLTKLKKIKMEK